MANLRIHKHFCQVTRENFVRIMAGNATSMIPVIWCCTAISETTSMPTCARFLTRPTKLAYLPRSVLAECNLVLLDYKD